MNPHHLVDQISTVYTQAYWRPITAAVYLVSLVGLAVMASKRWPAWGKWKDMGLPKLAMLCILIDAYVFEQIPERGDQATRF
ncbi:hypothetical protein RQP46_000481 [Phenoliferia psychrophenolica]